VTSTPAAGVEEGLAEYLSKIGMMDARALYDKLKEKNQT